MKVKQPGNFSKLNPELHSAIARLYKTGDYTVENLAKQYNVTTRTIQRIAKKNGVIRTQAEANKIAAPLKHYRTIPLSMRAPRKSISQKLRFELVTSHPFCTLCGMRPSDGVRLEVDHIDENSTNNDMSNFQILCTLCNVGKSHEARFGPTPVK